MKKLTLLLLMVSCGIAASAQRYNDMSADSIVSPTELRTIEEGTAIRTAWPFDVIVTNNGPDDVEIGDTIGWAARLTDKVSGSVKADVPGGGQLYPWILDRKINAGDTAHFVSNLTLVGGLSLSRDYIMSFYVTGYSGAYARDTITANNQTTRELVWYDLQGWNVGLENTTFSHNVHVNPNPANRKLTVKLLEINFTHVTLEVYDITGKLVKSVQEQSAFENNAYTLETSELNNGVYFLRVIDGEKVSTSKFAVSH